MNKKGFTLIELLAVIVILAVIALITAPIVAGIITNSRESSNKVSATNYIRAANTAITTAAIDNIVVEDGYYEILKNGNICLGEIEGNNCSGEILKINASGNMPINGNVLIENEEIIRSTIVFEEFSVEHNYDGKLEYKPFSLKYKLGDVVSVDTGTFGILDFYLIDEDINTITLLSPPIISDSDWNNETYHNSVITTGERCVLGSCTYAGPIAAYITLNTILADIPNLVMKDYEYQNRNSSDFGNSYQKLSIKNGVATITTHNGTNFEIENLVIKARLMSAEEILELASKTNSKFTHENLKNLLSKEVATLNSIYDIEATTIDEFLETMKIKDNWVNIYTLATTGLSKPELLETLILPNWLYSGVPYWTNTTFNYNKGIPYTTPILVSDYVFDANYHYGYSLRGVITLKKDDIRIQ